MNNKNLIKTIAVIVLSLTTATFVGLFVWMSVQYNDLNGSVDLVVKKAVVEAKEIKPC